MASSLPLDGKPRNPHGDHFVGQEDDEVSFSEFRFVVKHKNGEQTLSEVQMCEIDFKFLRFLLFKSSDDDNEGDDDDEGDDINGDDEALFAIS